MTGKSGIAVDRRAVIRLALAAALTPGLLAGQARAQGVPGSLIAPPAQPMVYRRTVIRDMADGSSFRVMRSFAVEFRRFSGGFMVHGQQSAVAVDAPAALAQFAELEQARDESGMFPMALDPFGRILSSAGALADEAMVTQAVERAFAVLSHQQLAQGERATIETLLATLNAAGSNIIAHLPPDLFAPAGGSREQEQSIALPDGSLGRLVTRFEARRDTNTGLMREAQRDIVTEVEGSRRTTSENWGLLPG